MSPAGGSVTCGAQAPSSNPAVEDSLVSHVPVMVTEVLELLAPRPGALLMDLTLGAGGHAAAWLEASAPDGRVLGCDRDPSALELAGARLAAAGARLETWHGTSAECLQRAADEGRAPDAILADLGVSSMQLDQLERGFLLREDALLDMRMDTSRGETAADYLARVREDELADVLFRYGDEPRSRVLAAAIVERRRRRPLRTTGDLRDLVEQVLRRAGGKVHPATRTFQALRMAVNDELPLLQETLEQALELLPVGARLAVIAFHSGEDRLVKRAFRAAADAGRVELLTRRPLRPSPDEVRSNRRARSARLRGVRRLELEEEPR